MKTTLLVIILICFSGCGVFRKTSKTTDQVSHSATKELESTALLLKSAGKETQTFTYWNDSGFYQFQQIKEQIDQAESTKLNTQESQQLTKSNTLKKSEPANALIFIGLVIILIVIFMFLLKQFKFLKFWHNN